MIILNIEGNRRMMRLIKIWWMKKVCWNLTNSKFKMLLIDFSPSQAFKDLNTWKVSNSYLKHNFKNKSKNSKLNLRRDRNKCKINKMELLYNQRVSVKKAEMPMLKILTCKNQKSLLMIIIKLNSSKSKIFHKLSHLKSHKTTQW